MRPVVLTKEISLLEAVLDVGRKPLRSRVRRPDDALTYAVNHWIRVEALAILHEGDFSVGEVARLLDEDVKVVRDHVKHLYDSGCIEFAGFKLISGSMRRVYRSLVLPVVGIEAYRTMSLDDRHDLNGAVVQGLHAETVCSFRNGKMDVDEDLCLVWQHLYLDAQGKRELLTHLTRAWEEAKEIGVRSVNRMARSGEKGISSIAALLGFERGRAGRPKGGYHRIGPEDDSKKVKAALELGRKPLRSRVRRPDDALTYAVNHWIRVEALAILHEGDFSVGEVARLLDEDVKVVRDHVKHLYDSGCIEFAGFKLVGGSKRPSYRSLVLPVVGVEAYRTMSLDDRHDLNGAVVQGLHAETVCSFRNGKMDVDENLCFVWQPLNLDTAGKRGLVSHLTGAWEGAKEIQARSADRMARSGEKGSFSIAAFLGFERGRAGRPKGGYHRPGATQKNASDKQLRVVKQVPK